MKTKDFRRHTSEETLRDLVAVTLEGKNVSKLVRTPYGEVYRDVIAVQTNRNVWNIMRSPTLVSAVIPGLEEFTCQGMYEGAPITEKHFMFLGTNDYAGRIFYHDKEKKIWGMTNHPVNDNNPIDIPHNVVYHFNQDKSLASIGIDYASTGSLGNNTLVRRITRASMQYAMRKVADKLKGGKK